MDPLPSPHSLQVARIHSDQRRSANDDLSLPFEQSEINLTTHNPGVAIPSSCNAHQTRPLPPEADGKNVSVVHGYLSTLAAYGPATLQSCAAALSVSAGVLALSDTARKKALQATQALSGATWAAADSLAQLHHLARPSPRSYMTSAGNVVGAIAGALSIGGAFAPGIVGLSSGYASATAWLLNAGASAATITHLQSRSARFLMGSSAVVNGTAAALSEGAEDAQRQGQNRHAAMLALASGSVWFLGAALAAGATREERRHQHIGAQGEVSGDVECPT